MHASLPKRTLRLGSIIVALILGLQPLTQIFVAHAAPPAAETRAPVSQEEFEVPPDDPPAPLYDHANDDWTPPDTTGLGSGVDLKETPPPLGELAPEPVPVILSLDVDRYAMSADEPLVLSFSVYPDVTRPARELRLSLTLPPAFMPVDGATVEWTIPALGSEDTLAYTVPVALAQPAAVRTPSVYSFSLTATAPDSSLAAAHTDTLVAVLPIDAGDQDAFNRASARADTGAALVSPASGILVLATPGSLKTNVQLEYTAGFDWRQASALPAPGELPQVEQAAAPAQELDNHLFLPHTAQSTGRDQRSVEAESTSALSRTVALSTTVDSGVTFYQRWHLEALQGEQEVASFDRPLLLVISTQELEAAGRSWSQYRLWTRPDAKHRWRPVETDYDAKKQVLVAQVTHFSDFGLGFGMTPEEPPVPSFKGYGSDLYTGGSTFSYPIDAPNGLGGMNPNISLNYSSVTIDDRYYHDGEAEVEAQADMVGYGWSLGGVNYITRIVTDTYPGYFSMVLNGIRVDIKDGDPNTAGDQWTTDPAIFAKVEWINTTNTSIWRVALPDGSFYEFGGAKPAAGWTPNTERSDYMDAGFELEEGSAAFRRIMTWYLYRAYDTLGNYIEYKYSNERGELLDPTSGGNNTCFPHGGAGGTNERWYTRNTYVKEILWHGHHVKSGAPTPAATPDPTYGTRLRLNFVYSNDDRTDIPRRDNCRQVKYTKKRLLRIEAQARKSNGAWHTLRQYTLDHAHVNTSVYGVPKGNPYKHMRLTKITHKSEAGNELNHVSFTYEETSYGGHSPIVNNVRLKTIVYGFGSTDVAKVTYTYQHKNTEEPDDMRDDRPRFPVIETKVEDGLGNNIFVTYAYSTPVLREHHHVFEFMGFDIAKAYYHPSTTLSSKPTSYIRYEEYIFHRGSHGKPPQGGGNPMPQPDPRKGKLKEMRVFNSSNTLVQQTRTDWTAWRWTSSGWSAQANWTEFPLWVRNDRDLSWTAGAGTQTKYFYETSRQGGAQYGNLTKTEEWATDASADVTKASIAFTLWPTSTTLSLLRTTVNEFYPNVSVPTTLDGYYIADRPGRVRVYDGSDASLNNCIAETRFSYSKRNVNDINNHNTGYSTGPQTALVIKFTKPISDCTNGDPVGSGGTWQNDTAWQFTLMTYDAYGNQIEVKAKGDGAVGDDITETTYDAQYILFPLQQSKGQDANFSVKVKYYGINSQAVLSSSRAFWGKIEDVCGVDGLCTRHDYDEFGRVENRWERVVDGAAWSATNDSADMRYNYYAPNPPNSKTYVIEEWSAPRCYGDFVRRYYNGLGQLVQEQRPQHDWTTNVDGCNPGAAGGEVDVDYMYDSLGRTIRTSAPRATTANWRSRLTNWSGVAYTATNYDTLGRPTGVIAPNGLQTSYDYDGRITWEIGVNRDSGDVDKVLHWQQTDGLGNIERVRTYNTYSGGSWTQSMEVVRDHDAAGRLLTVNQGALGTTTYTYNALGWLRTMNDSNLGAWEYYYSRQGYLTREVQPREAVLNNANRRFATCLYYDALGRVIGKEVRNYSTCIGWSNRNAEWHYDEGHGSTNRSRGKLTRVFNLEGSYAQQIAYNNIGLVKSETVTVTVGGTPQAYTTQYSYDAYDRPQKTTLPAIAGSEEIVVSYNSLGLPKSLNANVAGQPLVTNTVYDTAGRLRSMELPGTASLTTEFWYEPWGAANNKGGKLERILVRKTINSTALMLQDYSYDSFGNITAIWENGVNDKYSYDDKNRIRTVNYSNDQTIEEVYEWTASGNFNKFKDQPYTYDSTHTYAVNKIGGVDRYDYDKAGNMTRRSYQDGSGTWQEQTLTWNRSNQLARVQGPGGFDESYHYTPDGARYKKTNGGVETFYINPMLELEASSGTVTATVYYFFNGMRVAMRMGNNLHYTHSDHLGSTMMTTQGWTPTKQEYEAYGKVRSGGSLPTDNTYTGQKIDGSGLMYYNARYYDPQLGAFISPDTIIPDPGHPFGYNRYLYTFGNPLKYNDPTGHCGSFALAGGADGLQVMLQDPCTAGGLILAAGVAATVVAQQEMDYREYFPYGPTVLLEEEYTPLDNESPSDFVGPSRNNPLFDSTFKDPGFPLESSIPLVTTWTSSAQLDRNMQAANMPRPPDAAAHHIVAENDPRAALSRAILAGAGIDVNSADNGVYLPRNMNVPNPNNEAVHSRIHTDTYYREVERRLQVAQVAGRPITPVLQQIEQELLSDTFPYR